MNQKQPFGKRGRIAGRPMGGGAEKPQAIRQAVETYEDPALTKFAVRRPWPAIAAAAITVPISASVIYSARDNPMHLLVVLPIMLIVGVVIYLQLKGAQRRMGEEREREKRAIQASFPLIPIGGMIAGAAVFMVAKGQGPGDILAYDWSGIFGIQHGIATEEPLPGVLFQYMGVGGGAGLALASLWYRFTEVHQDNNGDPTLGKIIKEMMR